MDYQARIKGLEARVKELHEELQDIANSPAPDKVEYFNKVLAEKRALRQELQDTVVTTRRKHSDPCLEAWVSAHERGQ